MQNSSDLPITTNYSELVVELFRAIDFQDWKRLTNIFHNEIVYERPGYLPFIGIERLLQFYQQERIIASGTHQIEQITIEENYGACWGQFIGIGKDESDINERFADTFSFEDGKIKTRRTHFFRPAV